MRFVACCRCMSDTLRIEAWNWAREEFSHSDLANSQSTQRLVGMAATVAIRPAGCVSKVFTSAADSQGAYDFLENQRFDYQPIQQAGCAATLERCEHESFVFVPVDGSAVSVVDRGCCKDIGFIGTRAQRGRGEKVINACAVSSSGTPIGICTQVWWSRTSRSTKRNDVRKVGEKETRHWHTALENVVELYEQSTCRCWFQLDREADSWSLLRYLSSLDHLFTVRGNRDRVVRTSGGRRSKLRTVLSRRKRLGQQHVDVPATAKRSARRACIELRTTKTTLMLRDKKSGRMYPTAVNVVWAHEVGTTPKGEKPLDWVLLTNGLHPRAGPPGHLRLQPALAHRGLSSNLEERGVRRRALAASHQACIEKVGNDTGIGRHASGTNQTPVPDAARCGRQRRLHANRNPGTAAAQGQVRQAHGADHRRHDANCFAGHRVGGATGWLHRQVLGWSSRLDHNWPGTHVPTRCCRRVGGAQEQA